MVTKRKTTRRKKKTTKKNSQVLEIKFDDQGNPVRGVGRPLGTPRVVGFNPITGKEIMAMNPTSIIALMRESHRLGMRYFRYGSLEFDYCSDISHNDSCNLPSISDTNTVKANISEGVQVPEDDKQDDEYSVDELEHLAIVDPVQYEEIATRLTTIDEPVGDA